MTARFLWQADGPQQGARGVSDDWRRARQHAADLLRSGQASSALVEEAPGRRRWQARVGARGRVTWVPVKAGTAA